MRGIASITLVLFLASCPAATRMLVTGGGSASSSGKASASVGATVTVADPPENTATPIDERGEASAKLAACATGDVAAQVQIVSDFVDSCHEMIICGGLTNSFGISIISVLLGAAFGKDVSISTVKYKGDGVYEVGNVMTMTLVLGRDTSWGQIGDPITFDVMKLDSYFTGASISVAGGLSLGGGGGEVKAKLVAKFESVGPGIELLGLGANPSSGVQFDFEGVAKSIADHVQVANIITVDDTKGDSHIAYKLSTPPVRFGELLGHAPQGQELVEVSATRGTQSIEVTHWGMAYQPGSSGTLDGTIDFIVHGDFDYKVHFEYPHRKTPDVLLSCP